MDLSVSGSKDKKVVALAIHQGGESLSQAQSVFYSYLYTHLHSPSL